MTDAAQKIAEIRKSVEEARKTKGSWVDGQDYADDAKFLLDELDKRDEENRKLRERLKEELAWQDECLKLEEQLQSAQQEIERLRQLYERERENADRAIEQVKNLREERNQDRQWIEKASENVTQLQKERDKLIEMLQWYASDQPMVLYAVTRMEELEEALREIDTHIRSTPEPIQYIVETLKRVLPEYQEGVTVE